MPTEQDRDAHRYEAMIAALAARGIRAEFHRPGQLVISGRIWITWQGQWFISTWTPAVYPVPDGTDVVDVCLACQTWSGGGGFYTIPEEIAERFGLKRAEFDTLPEWFGDEADEDDGP